MKEAQVRLLAGFVFDVRLAILRHLQLSQILHRLGYLCLYLESSVLLRLFYVLNNRYPLLPRF